MCGVVALFSRDGPADELALSVALDRLVHRGPDGEGTSRHWDGRLLLGHRRLAIFDPTPDGHQPMIDPVTGNHVVFNGAIYNFPELRQELESLGHVFANRTDTEVILAAWRQWGEQAFARFNGMWAVLLFDAARDRLIVSRDRLGVKPLYFSDDGRRVCFGSDIRTVLAASGLPPDVDDDTVHDFLVAGLTDHSGRSFIAGIVEVPPGALWRVERSGTMRRGTFHRWPEIDSHETPVEPDAVKALLQDATRLRLRSDVPATILLSGGLDSSIVAYAATRPDCPRTALASLISYGYDGATRHDETERAVQFARQLGGDIQHDVLRVPEVPTDDDVAELVAAQEQPFNTPSLVAAFRLYRKIRERGVKVAVTGEGSDELFAGYTSSYMPLLVRDRLRAGRFAEAAALVQKTRAGLVANRTVWDLPETTVRHLIRRKLSAAIIADDFWHDARERFTDLVAYNRLPLPQRLASDAVRTRLPLALRYADRSGMASAIEVRSPFLDYRVVEMALSLPVRQRIDGNGGKRILRQAFAADLPATIAEGSKTHGLGMAEQFTVGRMQLQGVLDAPPALAERFLKIDRLRSALRNQPGNANLWWALSLLLWLRWRETTLT